MLLPTENNARKADTVSLVGGLKHVSTQKKVAVLFQNMKTQINENHPSHFPGAFPSFRTSSVHSSSLF